jgi:hypothetical protein
MTPLQRFPSKANTAVRASQLDVPATSPSGWVLDAIG